MKHLKNWKFFESINIDYTPTVYQSLKHNITFDMKQFNPELLDKSLIEELMWKLDDLVDDCEIEIGFMRTIPRFKPSKDIGCTDLMAINIKLIQESVIPRTQNVKRNYFNPQLLSETCQDISKTLSEFWDLETAICESYLEFSTIDEFFKYTSGGRPYKRDYLTDITIIIYSVDY